MQKIGNVLHGRYRLLRELGRGGFGLTFLAEDFILKRRVVIKVPNRAMKDDQVYEKFLKRFKREGESLAKLQHPYVVRVIDFFEDDQQKVPCLVMEYVKGPTLKELVRKRGKLPPDKALQQFQELAKALYYVHEAGLIHCSNSKFKLKDSLCVR